MVDQLNSVGGQGGFSPLDHESGHERAFKKLLGRMTSHLTKFFSSIEKIFRGLNKEEDEEIITSSFKEAYKQTVASHINDFELSDEKIQRELQDELTVEQKEKLLERVHTIKKDFFHRCMDDVSGVPSKFAGDSAARSLYSFLSDLTKLQIADPDNSEIKEIGKIFWKAYDFAVRKEVILRMTKPELLKKEYVGMIEKELRALEPGERFVYQVAVGGHAMMLEFQARERGLDIKLINSGEGIQHHYTDRSLAFFRPSAKYQTYLVENVNREEFLSSGFIAELVEKELPEGPSKSLQEGTFSFLSSIFEIGKIYKLINVHAIENAGGNKVRSDDRRMFHEPQHKGTCARRIYDYWMQENCQESEYKKYLHTTAKSGLDLLILAENLENKLKGTSIKVDSMKDRLFVQPHWLSKGVACLRNDMKTRTMVLMGEQIVNERKMF